jgi:hypothetical protein
VARDFSLGKFGGRFDPEWLKATVSRADAAAVVLRYGEVDVRRSWAQFPPDELYRLGRFATDIQDPQSHLMLGVYSLYAGLQKKALYELQAAKAGGLDAESYLKRLELLQGRTAEAGAPTGQEEASLLLLEARRLMAERAWDRALYRLALLRSRHEKGEIDVAANLAEIRERIAECKPHVARMELEVDLALGRAVPLLARKGLDEWQSRFGTWTLQQGVLRGEATEDSDAECLIALHHPPSYELAAEVRVVGGPGAILRLAGKARPNVGFWVNTKSPGLVGLLCASARDDRPAERTLQPFAFKPGEWYPLRAVVSPGHIEVAIGQTYVVRRANPIAPDPAGLQTYGLLVNPESVAELRGLSVRVLQEQ